MDIVSYILSTTFTKKSLEGMGALKGSPCTIQGIVDNPNGTHDITFAWKDTNNVTHTSVLTVKDGETPAFSSVAITGGHRLTFTTQDPAQSVSFNVMDGAKGDTGISVVASNVDDNNNLTLTLSNGNVINAGKIKAVTTVDSTLSTTSSNPVENKVITNALNNKVDKEMGKGLFSDEEKAKLANIEDGAQVNVLEKLIINGQEATITDKSIALTLITSAVSNLQNYYLKTETYTKQEVEDLIGSTVGVTIEIVEKLPTEGQSNVIYFLPTETEGVYSQYIYSNNSWILIGSTTVDLSNYYTKTQVDTLLNGKQNVLTIDSFPTALSNNPVASGGVYTAIAQMQPQFQFANMPTASSTNLGFVYQYTGATGTYTQNMFYRCIYDDVLGEYRWEEVIFHATVTVDSAISGTSTNPVQNKVIKEALDTKQDIMQYSTMPSAQDNLGKIVQYIGTNTSNYTNGYFYKAIYDSENDVYLWTVIKFSADMLVDNALSTTSENPVQNKVITGAINDIQDVIPSDASSTNQLVDRDSLGTASQKNFTPYVSPDNADVPLSSSVYSAITSAVYGAYHPSGSKTIAELTSDLLVFANIGNVYKITEDGVTTNLFVGGAGQTIHTGDNAVVVYGGQPNTFLFDLQSGSIDLTPYQTKALESAIEGTSTVEGALGALSTNKQPKTLTTSVESQTTVEGALGALSTKKASKVSSATNGNFAGLDASGNLTDSGKKPSDFQTALTFDDAPTENSNNPVKSGGVFTSEQDIFEVMGKNGAKNLITIQMAGRTGSYNGISYVFNNDGSVTLNGTATANTYIYLWASNTWANEKFKAGSYIASASLDKASETKVWFGADKRDASSYIVQYFNIGVDSTTPVERTFESDGEYYISYWVNVRNGNTVDNVTIYPMLRLASDTDSTYQPYAKTNQQLTAENEALTNQANDMVNVLGAKNLLPYPYYNTSKTASGITFTDNGDGGIALNGTSTRASDFVLFKGTALKDFSGAKLNGNPLPASQAIIQVERYGDYGGPWTNYGTAAGGADTTLANIPDNETIWIILRVFAGVTLNNVVVYPMIRLASIQDDTWVPYAKTNRELTEKIDIVGNLFTTTTKVVDNITHGIATTIATLENLPIGIYVVSGQFNSDSTMSGGGLVQFASSGVIQNGASCSTMINQGFKANAGLTGIFNVTNATNRINLQIYTANADLTVVSAKLAAIRIA